MFCSIIYKISIKFNFKYMSKANLKFIFKDMPKANL